jgi:hypothetical protein
LSCPSSPGMAKFGRLGWSRRSGSG